jgi:Spy/CpxP family protein refolding chaperone
MNNKTKSTAVLAATLLIGIAIGSMGYRAYVQYHFKKMSKMVHRGGIRELIERRIAPTQQQKDKVEVILDKYDSLLASNNREMREKIHNLVDSMWLELTPVLGAE